MNRVSALCFALLLAAAPALAAGPHVSTLPEGAASAGPDGRGPAQVPCDVLIRYDDGTDDQIGSGWTLGLGQRLGIVAQAPGAAPGATWMVQSVGFHAEFWVVPGDVNVQVTSVPNPANATGETLYVDSGGDWEVALTDPIVVAPGEEFAVMLCGGEGTWGVTGEDTASPDGRSYYSGVACSPDTAYDPPVDLMIWACVSYLPPTTQAIPTLGVGGIAALTLLLAGAGVFWMLRRRRTA